MMIFNSVHLLLHGNHKFCSTQRMNGVFSIFMGTLWLIAVSCYWYKVRKQTKMDLFYNRITPLDPRWRQGMGFYAACIIVAIHWLSAFFYLFPVYMEGFKSEEGSKSPGTTETYMDTKSESQCERKYQDLQSKSLDESSDYHKSRRSDFLMVPEYPAVTELPRSSYRN